MQDVLYIEDQGTAATLLQPLRIGLLERLAEPHTCLELAEQVGETPQKVYYHVKVLERAGLVARVGERRVRGINEGFYQATAHSYWISPYLVKRLGGPRNARNKISLDYLLTLAEELQTEVGHLAQSVAAESIEIPSVGLSAQIQLRDANQRSAFLHDLQEVILGLARKYHGEAEAERALPLTSDVTDAVQEGQLFRLVLACYPARIADVTSRTAADPTANTPGTAPH